jgi:hypothetical protein
VSVLFFALRPYSIFEVVFWHCESTLPYLFLGVAFFYGLSTPKPLWKLLAVTVPCLAFAIGINYSIVVPAFGLVAARLFLRRRPDAKLVLFSALVIVLLIFWSFVARNSPDHGPSYVGFDLGQLNGAVSVVSKNLVDAVYLGNVVVVLLAVCLSRVFTARFRSGGPSTEFTQIGTLKILLFTFSAAWMLMFSINSWIIANAFAWRYFVLLIWVGAMLFSLEVRGLVVSLSRRAHLAVSVLLVGWLIFSLAQPFVSLRDYKVFKHTRDIVPAGQIGYAGDYWLVWPAVMQNLMDGRVGFGFTYRGDGNLRNLRQYYRIQERTTPTLTVACLNESVERCCSTVKSYLGDVVMDGAKAAGDGIWLVDFHHDLARDSLMNAPLLAGEFALQLSANDIPPTWKSETGIRCKIRIRNKADVALSSVGGDTDDPGRYAIRLSYRWVENGRKIGSLDGFDSRTPLPTLLRPNEEMTLKMAIKAPPKPGRYSLEIEAVQELVAWFKDKGCPGIRIAVEVK